MKYDYSYGIIPLRLLEKKWQLLLVQHQAGHWSFPKGHAEVGETPLQTAERELLEETGIRIDQFLSEKSFKENYYFTFQGSKICKQVEYFIALVSGEISRQEEEIAACLWIDIEKAEERITFKEGKKIAQKVKEFLENFSL